MASPSPYYRVAQSFLDRKPAKNSTGSFHTNGQYIYSYNQLLASWNDTGDADKPRSLISWWETRLDNGGRAFSRTTNVHRRALESVVNADGSPGPLSRDRYPFAYSNRGG